jgi:multidrug efflux pump subunit AcrA (membrane-fusion protein)
MPLDIAVRHALLRIGAVAVASGISALVLLAVGRLILIGDLGVDMPSFSQPGAPASPSPSPTPSPTVLSDIATPSPSPTPTPEPSPTETAAPTPSPLELTAFRFGGRSYVGVVVPDVDRTFVAPFAGTVQVQTYQFIDGEVRVGSNVPSLPFYPYISVVAPNRRITYRSGTLGSVTEVLASDGTTVAAGDPLFRLITLGRSSWTTFYNSSAPYQVVVSLQSLPSGRDLDATVYLGGG